MHVMSICYLRNEAMVTNAFTVGVKKVLKVEPVFINDVKNVDTMKVQQQN